jgi:hypothetical protein
VGGSATGAAALSPPSRVVRRLAGLSAGLAGAERRFNLPVLRAAALREDMVWAGARRNLSSRAKPVAPKVRQKLAPTCAKAKRILPRSFCLQKRSKGQSISMRTEVAG